MTRDFKLAANKSRRPTLRDVANLAGVDPSLVSRVVSNDPRSTASAKTANRIMAAVHTLGYKPNLVARGLRISRTSTLGLLLPGLNNPMYNEVVIGAEQRALELGYGVVIGIHTDGAPVNYFTRLLEEGRVDALLIASGVFTDEFMRGIANSGNGPVVMVNRRVKGVKASVIVDDTSAAAMAVEHLVGLGHKHIAGLFGPATIDTTRRRRMGYQSVMKRHNLKLIDIEMPSWGIKDGQRATNEILMRHPQVTALFASTLLMGVGAIRASVDLGRKVPGSVSVIALHDSEIAEFFDPSISTVRLPSREMGARAVDLAISMIEGGEAQSIMVKSPIDLVARNSAQRQ